jgi:small subunit ribosomal protein S1
MNAETTEHIPTDSNNLTSAAPQEESFAELFAKSSKQTVRFSPGQKITAKIVSITGDLAFIDLGDKSEGAINLSEFRDKEGNYQVKAGDEFDAFFVSVENGIRKFTTLIRGYSAVSLKNIRDAFEAEIPVQGEIKREVKGGFEVLVGDVRCFCPFSQIDLKGGREGGVYLGRTFPFKVLEFEEQGKNIILSRRALLEKEKAEKVQKLKETLHVGMDVAGTVRSVMNFGAFVDLGGIDGLIPASELSWVRNERPADILSVGQQVTARILSVDWESNKLSLSLKAMEPDPWTRIAGTYAEGSRVTGKIVRLAPFGAFVNLEPGIDGLIHISNLGAGRRINHPKEVVEVGQTLEAYVLSVDAENRKISLSINPKVEPEKIVLPAVGDILEGKVEKIMPFGVFVKLKSGLTGLIPNNEMATAQGADHKKMFPEGSDIKVAVIEVDTQSNKVRLSRKAAMDMAVKQEYEEYLTESRQAEGSTGGLGTLGDLLKAKLEGRK